MPCRTTERIVKKFLLAIALTSAFAAGAIAQSDSSIPPRDPPFGKGNSGNDSMHEPNSADSRSVASDSTDKSEAPKSAKSKSATKHAKKDNSKKDSAKQTQPDGSK
jgi:hypothetical protein